MSHFFSMTSLSILLAVVLPLGAGADQSSPVIPHGATVHGDEFSARCRPETASGPAVRLAVAGLRDDKGSVRIQLYDDDPDGFLEKGSKLYRIQVAAPADTDTASVCLPFDRPGTYAIIVIHDRDDDGKADVFSEGFGFSNNPRLKLRKPHYDEVAFTVDNEILDMQIEMQYFGGNKRRRGRR